MRFTRSGWVRLGALNPLGRFGLPDELAAMVAWLGGAIFPAAARMPERIAYRLPFWNRSIE